MPISKIALEKLIDARVSVVQANGKKLMGTLRSQSPNSICILVDDVPIVISKCELSDVTEAYCRGMTTDAEITQAKKSVAGSKGGTGNKYLTTTFEFDDDEGYLPEMELSKVRPALRVDQFSRNEQLTGLKSSYDFNSYTIDVSTKNSKKKGSAAIVGLSRSSLKPQPTAYKPGCYVPPSMRKHAPAQQEEPAGEPEKEDTTASVTQISAEASSLQSSFSNFTDSQQERPQPSSAPESSVSIFSSNPDNSQLSLRQSIEAPTPQRSPSMCINMYTNPHNVEVTVKVLTAATQAPSFSAMPSFSSAPSFSSVPAPAPAPSPALLPGIVTLNNYSQNISPTSPSMNLLTLAAPEGN